MRRSRPGRAARPGLRGRLLPVASLAVSLAAGLAAAGLATACADPARMAVERGDRLLAEGRLEPAIAEYRLSLRQGGDDPRLLLRLGDAYARSGEVDETVRLFGALLERDSAYRYQVAATLNGLARQALERGARESMRRALRPLAGWDVGLIDVDLRLALARLNAAEGEYALALALFLSIPRDLENPPPTVPYEIGRAYEELGGCVDAIPYFERFLSRVGGRSEDAPSARWHLGNCLFLAAEGDRSVGRPRSALAKLDRMVELGVPLTLLERAQYLRGELLLGLGNPDEALDAYNAILRLNPSRTGFLSRRAEERIREIRHGGEDL
ncbi:MAG: tetratricopeptide repeat protein [Gemmatimonadota bacterium]